MKKITSKIEHKLDPRLKKSSKDKHDPWATGYSSYSYNDTLSNTDTGSTQTGQSYWSSSPAAHEGYEEARRRASEAGEPLPPTPPSRRQVPKSEDEQLRMALELSKREEEERVRRQNRQDQEDRELQVALELSKKDADPAARSDDPFAPVGGYRPSNQSIFGNDPFAPPGTGASSHTTTPSQQAAAWGSAAPSAPSTAPVASSGAMSSAGRKSSLYEKEAALKANIGEQGFEALLAKQGEYSELDAVLKGDTQKKKMVGYGFANLHRLWGVGDCAVLVCLCIRLLVQGQMTYDEVERRFGNQAVDVSSERRSLLQFLYEHAANIPQLREPLMMEAEMLFPDVKNPLQLIQQYVTKMTQNQQYLGISEMSAGAFRDNYILVFVRERPHNLGGGLDVSGMVSPPGATRVFYTLFYDTGHFDLLEPLPISMSDSGIFAGCPTTLRSTLETLHKEQTQQYAETKAVPPPSMAIPSSQPLVPVPVGPAGATSPNVRAGNPGQAGAQQSQKQADPLGGIPSGDNLWSKNKELFGNVLSSEGKGNQKQTLATLAAQKGGQSGGVSPVGGLSPGTTQRGPSPNVAQMQTGMANMSISPQPGLTTPMGRGAPMGSPNMTMGGMGGGGGNMGYGGGMGYQQPNMGMGYGGMQQQQMGRGMGMSPNMGMAPNMGMQPMGMGYQQPNMGMGMPQQNMGMQPNMGMQGQNRPPQQQQQQQGPNYRPY
eukprot:comp23245_c0_seq2/m.37958 comp23245_c0_seq2/g.37958  ORF comp23245_c0_seq2/g.37958 comp23245_c0_seq2/m.37958 type:complete len:714 (-) comp23245_c0_seq2:11-2152(-)